MLCPPMALRRYPSLALTAWPWLALVGLARAACSPFDGDDVGVVGVVVALAHVAALDGMCQRLGARLRHGAVGPVEGRLVVPIRLVAGLA